MSQAEASMQNRISDIVNHSYYTLDVNCAKTTLITLSKLFDFKLEEQVVQSATAMNGAGRSRGQCGLVEGMLMFLGVFFAARGQCDDTIVRMARKFTQKFQKEFNSISCKELRPGGFRPEDPKHMCAPLTLKTVQFCYDFIQGELSGRSGFELQLMSELLD